MVDASQSDPQVRTVPSNEELKIAFSGPAVLSNKFYVTATLAGLRIAFTEQRAPDEGPVFRTAVLVPYPDAIALLGVLSHALKGVQIEQRTASAPSESE